jgi:hypothetical protein
LLHAKQISMHVPRRALSVGFMAQLINQIMFGFEVQTKKPSR